MYEVYNIDIIFSFHLERDSTQDMKNPIIVAFGVGIQFYIKISMVICFIE